MKLLLRTLIIVLVVLAALPLALLALLGTETGTRWLLDQAAEFSPKAGIFLQFDAVRGTFLHDIRIDNLRAELGQTTIEAAEVGLRWHPGALRHARVEVAEITLRDVRYAGTTAAEAAPRETGPPVIPELALPVEVRVERFVVDGLSVRQDETLFELRRIAASAQLDAGRWTLYDLDVRRDDATLAGRLALEPGSPHAVDGTLGGWLDLPGQPRLAAELDLAGEALNPRLGLRVTEPAAAQVTADLELAAEEPRFAATATWSRLAWPLQGDAEYWTERGELTVRGSPSDYRLQLAGSVEGAQVPAAQLDLKGQGNTTGLTVEGLTAAGPLGRLTLDGTLDWAPDVQWDLRIAGSGIDPSALAPEWPGNLQASLATQGKLVEAGVQGRVVIRELTGTLRDYPASATGILELDGTTFAARELVVATGPNRVRVDGTAGERLAAEFSIDAPALDALYPGLEGSARGGGRIGGTLERPELTAEVAADALGYEDLALQRLALEARWQADGGSLRLEAGDGRAGGLVARELALRLDGTPEAHRLELDVDAEPLAAAIAAAGGWSATETRWQGTLERLELDQPQAGPWSLARPARLVVGADEANLEQACLEQEVARLCLDGGYRGENLDARASLARVPLERLAFALPEHIDIEGVLEAGLDLGGTLGDPQGSLRVAPSDGRLLVADLDEEGEPLALTFEDVLLEARFADDRAEAELGMRLDGDGVTRGTITVGPGPARELGGEVSARFPDLSLISGIVPDLTQVAGRLLIALELGGRVDAPQFAGELRIDDGSADLAAAGLELRELTLSVTGDGTGPLRIEAGVSSGGGRLGAQGTVDPTATPGPAVDLGIAGDRFLAARLPEAQVWISPELRLAGSRPYHLSGTIRVPQTRVEIKTLPQSSIKVSEDEIVIGEDDEEQEIVPTPPSLTTDVRLILGDQVRLEGFGLETRLEGAVDARVNEQGTRLDGSISLAEGKFEAFGQELTIEQGRLLFAGPPSRPEVDLRAVRVSNDQQVRAYLAAAGPVRKPQTRVYSEPALPQAEALAYLLTGRGLDQANQSEGLNISAAALSLGLSRGEPLLQDMAARLGLDELRVTAGDDGVESTALLIGKQLNPDVYLGFSQNIFDPAGSVLLRLRLTDRLEVETAAGEAQSVDLFYRYEHD